MLGTDKEVNETHLGLCVRNVRDQLKHITRQIDSEEVIIKHSAVRKNAVELY